MTQDITPFATTYPSDLQFLAGGGNSTQRILARDWSDHPLGAPRSWPAALKTNLSLILNSPESMILAWGKDDLFFFFNDKYTSLLGPRAAWAMGTPFCVVWADAWEQAKPIIEDAFSGRSQRFNDLPWTLSTDRGVANTWFTFSYSRVLDADGKIAGLFVFTNETTGSVRAHEALKISEAAAREDAQRVQLALAAGAIIGTWFWDIPNNRFSADEPFARAFGLGVEVCKAGIPLTAVVETVHPDDRAGLIDAINAAIVRGGPYVRQYRVRREDGRYYWVEANGHVDYGPDGKPLSFPGVLIDAEKRKEVESERDVAIAALHALNDTLEQRVAERSAALMVAEEALRQSQKMEAVGQLTGGLAHDFNNLLAGISGSLQMLQTRIDQGRLGELKRYMAGAQDGVKRAAALTHRLLAFSRRQTLEPKATDIDRLVAGMEDMVRRTVGPAVSVTIHRTVDLWPTLVDPNQLENALLNLCINSRDAMPDGGRIVIETANRKIEGDVARNTDMLAGDYVSLAVSDSGVGMTPEIVSRVFEPFFTTKPIGLGTGLGLSMIYGFSKQSGGQVRVHSEVGVGTTVTIFLPRHSVKEVVHADAAGTLEKVVTHGETVLVIDDEPLVRMLVVDVLLDLGYRTLEAADGPEGLALLRSSEKIDLLITDVGLPNGMNGRQVADAGRNLRAGLKVLFITGYAENAVLNGGHLEEGMQVISKPFDIAVLSKKIQELISA